VGDVGEFVCFYPNKRRARVVVNLNAQSWDCAFVEKVKLSESFVDLVLCHIALWLPEVAATKYHVASTNIHGCMTAHLHEQQQRDTLESWEWLGDMGHRRLLSGHKDQNTVVVPYYDHGHWTLFVLEDAKTYHFGAGMDVHDNMWADNYVTLLHVAYATALGKNPGHADWWRVVACGVSKYSWGGDYTSWECGYVMAYMF
jgi:hypothetical protein